MNWWEEDTSAVIWVRCRACGELREVSCSTQDTDGQKVLNLDGWCEEHEHFLGIGEGDD